MCACSEEAMGIRIRIHPSHQPTDAGQGKGADPGKSKCLYSRPPRSRPQAARKLGGDDSMIVYVTLPYP